MEKNIFLKDYLVSRVISFGKTVEGYNKIYYQTNEDLFDTYLDTDFQDKTVFSVLASGDHVLTSRLLDAKVVDAFDYNRLPIYYFYLRIWAIQYKDTLYPDILNGNNRWLANLLRLVKPTNDMEAKALFFFKKHLQENTRIENLFFDINAQPKGKTLYETASEVKDCISPDLAFFNIDLFKRFELETTYDILLISNILEWARNNPERLKIAHDNLSRLLNPEGVIICSNLINRNMEEERKIFKDFEFSKKGQTYIYKKK